MRRGPTVPSASQRTLLSLPGFHDTWDFSQTPFQQMALGLQMDPPPSPTGWPATPMPVTWLLLCKCCPKGHGAGMLTVKGRSYRRALGCTVPYPTQPAAVWQATQ